MATAIVMITACGSTEPPDLDIATPATFTAAQLDTPTDRAGTEQARTEQTIDPKWWLEFDDSTLDRLIAEALDNNPGIEALAATARAAHAQARIEGAQLAPQVGAGFNASRRRQNFIGLPIPGADGGVLSTTSTNLGLQLSVDWEADLWGRLAAGKQAALADAAAAERDLDAARLSLAGQVARTWFQLIETRQQVELAERTVASRGSTLERLQARYERGLSPSLEVRLGRTQLSTVEAQLAALEATRDAFRRQLEILLGRYPSAELAASPELPEVPALPATGLPADLLARRPDLQAAEARALATSARLRAAQRALYPRLTLNGTTGTASNELSDLLDGDFSVWSLASGLLQPIFQGGRLRASVDLAEAGLDGATARFLDTALRAFADVETALASEHWLDRQLEALEAATEESRAAEKLAFDRYNNGLADYLSVLESQRSAFTSESQTLTARRRRLEARIDLILALGGGYQIANSAFDTTTPTDGSERDSASAER